MSEGGKRAVKVDEEVVAAAEVRELKKRIRELERVLGRKTLEKEILKEAVSVAHENLWSPSFLQPLISDYVMWFAQIYPAS
jgi:hypothetical protein